MLRDQLTFDRWTGQNREIVRHDLDCNHPVEGQLLSKYKEPSSSETVVTQTTVMTELNRHNYRQKMHKLLELEEMTRHQIISRYMWSTLKGIGHTWQLFREFYSVNVLTVRTPKCVTKWHANSADPDQTAPEGAVWSGSTLFTIPISILSKGCIESKI